MAQYLEIKVANPDCLLWYRMGDFYELFFEDAITAAKALGITLTKRGRHRGEDIPMCGVPVVRADEYLDRLIKQRYRVAVCEQLEDPAEARKRGSKAVVKRDVVRIVTPGTLTDDTLLEPAQRNFLAGLALGEGKAAGAPGPVALAMLDLSTGELEVAVVPAAEFAQELARVPIREVVATEAALRAEPIARPLKASGIATSPAPGVSFDPRLGERLLKGALGVAELAAFGAFTPLELQAIGGLLRYVELTQVGRRPRLSPPRRLSSGSTLTIDAASRASLELERSTSGSREGSLLSAIDRTLTGPGARELVRRLATPLLDVATINARLDAVGFLFEEPRLREQLRQSLRGAPDIARALCRLALQRGTPRDLAAIRDGLRLAATLQAQLTAAGKPLGLPAEVERVAARLGAIEPGLLASLEAALVDEPPTGRALEGTIRAGFRADLDAARALSADSRRVIAELEARYAAETGIRTLKVRHNAIVGYFVEVSQLHAKSLTEPPLNERFRHRQTLVNAARFSTDELADLETRIAEAAERAASIEAEAVATLVRSILAAERPLAGLAEALAEADVVAALAELAAQWRYVRPAVDEGLAFEIRGGRHPVVEQVLKEDRQRAFIENDCVLGRPDPELRQEESKRDAPGFNETAEGRIWLVTGPNMAGKSTFLRQNALIAILAQMGSFVPAESAHIGVVDRVFSRVGASDDLARGRSTFMVEMVETAAILNQATPRSLVILDEIGRGTATFDGLSIAWAAVEHLHKVNRSRVLFATHYHELTELARELPDISNVAMDVSEWNDEIVFLHKVRAGAANRSYGIQVGKLAGLPDSVVQRARVILEGLEKTGGPHPVAAAGAALDELPLFRQGAAAPSRAPKSAPAEPPSSPQAEKLREALAALNPDAMTPRAALEALYTLKAILKETETPPRREPKAKSKP